jgi:hypothetical protein
VLIDADLVSAWKRKEGMVNSLDRDRSCFALDSRL